MLARIKQWMQGGAAEGDAPGPSRGDAAELNILMVCSGNICRSPTAEAVLRTKLQRAGLAGVRVDSAGTHGYHLSEAPDARAQAAALRRGYDRSRQRARPVHEADCAHFQWLLARDQSHLAWLQKRSSPGQLQAQPEVQATSGPKQVRLLMQHARRFQDVSEVPDPYYGGPEGFERVLDLVEDACEGLVQLIARQQVVK